MKLVFAGTPDFAAAALAALIAAGHDIALVLTQPDRPSGRGLHVMPSPVKALALGHGIDVLQPLGLRPGGRHDVDAQAAHARLIGTPHDAMVVAAYGLILPSSILVVPPHGCINIHASLLPRWRGAAPIQRAIQAGDVETGITIMQMDAGLDTGPVLAMHRLAIGSTDTGGSLTGRLATLGAEAILAALPSIRDGTLRPHAQHPPGDESGVTHAAKLAKSESALDFTQSSRALVDRIRAFDPWPGCSATVLEGEGRSSTYRIWRAEAMPASMVAARSVADRAPGTVLGIASAGSDVERAIVVATGDGAVALTQLQKPGGKRQAAIHFHRDLLPGARFAAVPA